MKIAVVIQRYGAEITGGSEAHCMAMVGRLAQFAEVEVITTCAKDYVSWRNEYAEGTEIVNGTPVHRFKNDRVRQPRKFDDLSQQLYTHPHSYFDEVDWMVQQGPYAPGMFDYIKEHTANYDAFLFYTYLYPTTFFGIQYAPQKSILVSTAHNEPPLYFDIFRMLFHLPKAFLYLTEEEKELVHRTFRNQYIPHETLGTGVEVMTTPNPDAFRQKYGIDGNFLIYAGRIDEGKGCGQMIEFFLRYKARDKIPSVSIPLLGGAGNAVDLSGHPFALSLSKGLFMGGSTSSPRMEYLKSTALGGAGVGPPDNRKKDLTLVLMGKSAMRIPNRPDIRMLGFVSDEDKINGMSAATLLVMPSIMESLSIVTLEAWSVGTPVIVNGGCAVLRGHCIRSNGGLYYTDYDEFEACLDLLLGNRELAAALGENGKEYIQRNYQWDIIDQKLLKIVELVAQSRSNGL
jgi:glycosyltransferase involved in cell wall biosynthesis